VPSRISVAALFLLIGLSHTILPGKPGYRQGLAAVTARDSLLNVDREFNNVAAEKGFVEAFLEFMADDAMLFPAGSEPVSGRDNIRKHLSEGSEGATLTWMPVSADVSVSSDLGYTRGTSEYRYLDKDKNPAVHYGKYVTVWKRQPDGRWKFILDIGNASPPPVTK